MMIKNNNTYKEKGWKNFGDWLGTGRIADGKINYLDFITARNFVRKLGLQTVKDWKNYTKSNNMPENIPATPHYKYKKDGLVNYGDWMGTGRIASHLIKYRDFKSARDFARSLKLNNSKEWSTYCKSGKNLMIFQILLVIMV